MHNTRAIWFNKIFRINFVHLSGEMNWVLFVQLVHNLKCSSHYLLQSFNVVSTSLVKYLKVKYDEFFFCGATAPSEPGKRKVKCTLVQQQNYTKMHGQQNYTKMHGQQNYTKMHGQQNYTKMRGQQNYTKMHGQQNLKKILLLERAFQFITFCYVHILIIAIPIRLLLT